VQQEVTLTQQYGLMRSFTFGDGATGWATFDLVLRAVARAAMVRWPANFVLCSHF